MAGKNVLAVSDRNFETEVIKSDEPVLVDFTATWYGSSRQLAPFVDQLADECVGEMIVAKRDIDDSPGTAARFRIRGVPTLIVFKGDEPVAMQMGGVPKTILQHTKQHGLGA